MGLAAFRYCSVGEDIEGMRHLGLCSGWSQLDSMSTTLGVPVICTAAVNWYPWVRGVPTASPHHPTSEDLGPHRPQARLSPLLPLLLAVVRALCLP